MANYMGGHLSDQMSFQRSKHLFKPAAGTHDCIYIPKNTFVLGVYFRKITAFTAGIAPTITVGFSGNGETADPDFFMTSAVVIPGSTGITKSAAPEKFFTESGILTVTTTQTLTAGEGIVYALFAQIW